MSAAEIIGTVIGNIIGVMLFPLAVVWFARSTQTGAWLSKGLFDLFTWPRRSRAAERARCTHNAYAAWVGQLAYWGHVLAEHDPGTPSFELAHDSIRLLELNRPERCACPACRPAPCPYGWYTCDRPHCPNHPRSHQS